MYILVVIYIYIHMLYRWIISLEIIVVVDFGGIIYIYIHILYIFITGSVMVFHLDVWFVDDLFLVFPHGKSTRIWNPWVQFVVGESRVDSYL